MKKNRFEIDTLVRASVAAHPDDLVAHVARELSLSPRMALKHVSRLVADGVLISTGRTKGRRYAPAGAVAEAVPGQREKIDRPPVEIFEKKLTLRVASSLRESEVWRALVEPDLADLPENVRRICQHGVTEIVNNVVDHSGASRMTIGLSRVRGRVSLEIADDGVGVFEKIRSALGLSDFKEAALELYKGKFTTDPSRHSGEGIFFTSRAFDGFRLKANGVVWARLESGAPAGEEPTEVEDFAHDPIPGVDAGPGTAAEFSILESSPRTLRQVFDAASVDPEESFAFDKTSFPLAAAQTATGPLASRSQAKRVLARLESFRAVELDFAGVAEIGQAFADEIFRVFRVAHPGTTISWKNAAPEVERMIRRAAP